MKSRLLSAASVLAVALLGACGGTAPAASVAAPASAGGKASAQLAPQGFGQSYQEIVKLAEQETASSPVQWCSSMEENLEKVQVAAFQKLFPNVHDEFTRCDGTDTRQKILLELQAGKVSYDMLASLSQELYQDYVNAGVLAGPFDFKALGFPADWGMQDRVDKYPAPGYGISGGLNGGGFPAVIFNSTMVPAEHQPKSLADCLDPYWSGKEAVDIRPNNLDSMGLPELWGEQRLLDWSKKLAANNPIWVRGKSATTPKIQAGQLAMMCGSSFVDLSQDIPPDSPVKVIVPDDLGGKVGGAYNPADVVVKGTKKPNAALLLAMFFNSNVASEAAASDPRYKWQIESSVPGSPVGELLKQKGLSVVDTTDRLSDKLAIEKKIVEAWGFPTAGK